MKMRYKRTWRRMPGVRAGLHDGRILDADHETVYGDRYIVDFEAGLLIDCTPKPRAIPDPPPKLKKEAPKPVKKAVEEAPKKAKGKKGKKGKKKE